MQRKQEVIALLYRVGIAYLIFGLSRLLFVYFNQDIIQVYGWGEMVKLVFWEFVLTPQPFFIF